jgi:hypothetical protein
MMFGRQMTNCLAIGTTALLLQACANAPPPASTARVFQADMSGGAKNCVVPKITAAPGQVTPVEVKVGNDGGWCGIIVSAGGKPFSAGLLVTEPAHGKVVVHTVGDATRIDYTPAPRFAGTDSFSVKLVPGAGTVTASVTVTPS